MSSHKPFSWTVRFTVSPLWVADGFALCNERAQQMLMNELSCASVDEAGAEVLETPNAADIAHVQGYIKGHADAAQLVADLKAGTPAAGTVSGALRAARKLLDSVAFVAVEGDTAPILEKIDAALALLYARQGEAVSID